MWFGAAKNRNGNYFIITKYDEKYVNYEESGEEIQDGRYCIL